MDDTEDDARYPPNPYASNYHQSYPSSHRAKLPVRNPSYGQPVGDEYGDEDDEEDEEEVAEEEEEREEEEAEEEGEEEEEDEEEEQEDQEQEENGVQKVVEEAEEDEDGEEDDDDDDDDEDDDGDRDDYGHRRTEIEEEDSERHRKKRKLKNLGYEFAPRMVAPSVVANASAPRPSYVSGRNSPADWTESSTFVLLDAWGDRFVQLGRKSLRSDEWHEVAKKVSQASKTIRTDTQCRNRLDTLKKKYKKEKMKLAETGETNSKWVYFKKLDALLSSSSRPGLSCGLDSGEYVFMNPRDYLNRSNGLDEMRDSPGNSESSEHDDDDSDGLPPKRRKSAEAERGGSSFRLLADSIQKFGEIYEKIENNKRQQMIELEKMRMEFHRDLEMQKRKIMERAQAEIVKIRQGDDEEVDVSTENTSG